MSDLPINVVDGTIIVILLVSGVFAFMRGFVREVLAIVGWAGAVLVTLQVLPYALPYAERMVSNAMVARSLAAMAIFFATLVFFSLVSNSIGHKVRQSGIGALDRSFGFLFGLARGGVAVCLIFFAFAWLYPDGDMPRVFAEARFMPQVQWGGEKLLVAVPDKLMSPSEKVSLAYGLNVSEGLDIILQESGADSDDETGYNAQTIKGMDQLFKSTQDD